MKVNNIQSCHLGPEISPEQFISDHFFLCLLKGSMKAYDGRQYYAMEPGDYCVARKNHLVRYTKYKDNDAFEKIIITLDEPFLKQFSERHHYTINASTTDDAFLFIKEDDLIHNFIRSLEPYYNGTLEIDETFSDIKREELLLILLKCAPELTSVFFNFSIPEKIDIEAFMNHHFRFNLSLERFAFLTGRSLSAFKRDFQKTFGVTPGIWLKKKRLQEAHFQITHQHRKPSDVYLEVGFENLSHFSYAFKNEFGYAPNILKGNSSKKG